MLETIQKVVTLTFLSRGIAFCFLASSCCNTNSFSLDELRVLGQNFEFQLVSPGGKIKQTSSSLMFVPGPSRLFSTAAELQRL